MMNRLIFFFLAYFPLLAFSQNNTIFFGGSGGGSSMACSALPIILPLELIDFTTECLDQKVSIKWKTATEHNTSSFEIEKSLDGLNWQKIAEVEAAGFSNKVKEYSTSLEINEQKTTYLRLKMIDDNRSFTYSKLIYVNPCYEHLVKIFPNPSTSFLKIALPQASLIKEITLCNTLGQIVRTINFLRAGDVSLDLTELPSSVYFVCVVKKDDTIESHKWIKLNHD